MARYLVGVDEAGRGPLAGPVAVGVVAVAIALRPALVRYGVKDSKKLTEQDRERWYRWLNRERRRRRLNFTTALISHRVVDERGITAAVRLGIRRCLNRLGLRPEDCAVLLDGGLKAPVNFPIQKTVIRGDETVPIIALASVAAKVRRDRRMRRLACRFPHYRFEDHKGYGTPAHYAALKKYGPSLIHRRTFLRNLLS